MAVLVVGALALFGFGARGTGAYQFLPRAEIIEYGRANFSPEPPFSWSPEVWPPGGVLSFVLEDSPLWRMDIQEVRSLTEEALAFWSSIPTADIRWEVGRIASAEESRLTFHPFSIRIWDSPRSRAKVGFTDGRWNWEIDSCDIVIGVPSRLFWDEATIEEQRQSLIRPMAHELGHCLGLDHPGEFRWGRDFEIVDRYRRARGDRLPPWQDPEPIMLKGYPEPGVVPPSDRIGASLLRPRPGWLASVGSLYGQVRLEDGQGAAFVKITVSKLGDDGTLEESFVRITDRHGAFVAGGLDPGRYVLLARPISYLEANIYQQGHRIAYGATGAVRATILATPVPVSAGRHTGPITLTMRRGENLLPVWR